MKGKLSRPAMELTKTMRPLPRSNMPGSTAWVRANGAKKLISKFLRTTDRGNLGNTARETNSGVVNQHVELQRQQRVVRRLVEDVKWETFKSWHSER